MGFLDDVFDECREELQITPRVKTPKPRKKRKPRAAAPRRDARVHVAPAANATQQYVPRFAVKAGFALSAAGVGLTGELLTDTAVVGAVLLGGLAAVGCALSGDRRQPPDQ